MGQAAHAFAYGPLPENTSAFSNCTAKVKVNAARMRTEPSFGGRVMGLRHQDESVYVTRVHGKWVQVLTPAGDTAYMAAYLLSFPYHDLLEQWKRETPSPSVGKKAKVKWAQVIFRKYPSAAAPPLGSLEREDGLAVLADLGTGWSLVESRTGDGKSRCYGFVSTRALAAIHATDAPGAFGRAAPLARLRRSPGRALEPSRESPSEYLARTAWSPDVFLAEHKANQGVLARPGELLASLH